MGYPSSRKFSSLSVADLIEARDHYHKHLAHLENVVATAVGLYRIIKGDWWETHSDEEQMPAGFVRPADPRRLSNTVVKPWSWPCVLVFVREWEDPANVPHPDQVVPRFLYLPDGRVVPTCVIEMSKQDEPVAAIDQPVFPPHYVGGGYPVYSYVQGRQHFGSIGCLVTDGNLTYALTNRHVTGEGGRTLYTQLQGVEIEIGTSDALQAGKRKFEEVYDGLRGRQVFANLDAGLVRIHDVSRWTTQVRGLGQLDTLIDLNPDTLTLDFIECKVRAFGAASGAMYGTIAGFFYRYKSVGGFDYVADLVILPREAPEPEGKATDTLPGDSGTLWCLEQEIPAGTRLRPLALQWGGQVSLDGVSASTTPHSFTLATAVSTICRELDVDLLRGWNEGLPEYWGAVGHYTIAARACAVVDDPNLGQLLRNNLARITYPESSIDKNTGKGLTKAKFVPLADVPDYVWKPLNITKDKPNPHHRSGEQPNHFADMDKRVDKPGAWNGLRLLDLCTQTDNIDVGVWQKYYTLIGDRSKGTLPFRVWQIFDEMVRFLRDERDVPSFVAAAGVLAHYIGDACQPLHISSMFNGDGDRGKGVHEAYEKDMLNKHVPQIIGKLQQEGVAWDGSIAHGRDAAIETVVLMQRTFGLLDPAKIVDAFANEQELWPLFNVPTVLTMANGISLLAALWNAAWSLGGGDSISSNDLGAIDEKDLVKIYTKPSFLPSKRIKDIGTVLKPHDVISRGPSLLPPAPAGAASAKSPTSPPPLPRSIAPRRLRPSK